MSQDKTPALSAILITFNGYKSLRRTIAHFRAQNVADQIEVVVVAPSGAALDMDEADAEGLHSITLAEVQTIEALGQAQAEGVRAASAPLVVFCEDHGYPQPGWAEALIAAHSESWAAVGPVIENANPDSMISWAELLMSYRPWTLDQQANVVDEVPPHNSSYKRHLLLDYGSELEKYLQVEVNLSHSLRAQGHQLYLEPAARIKHLNYSRLGPWLHCQYLNGRMVAAARALHWPLLKRVIYTGGTPLIPAVVTWRILKDILRSGQHSALIPRFLPALVVGLTAGALGELVGFTLGSGDVVRKFSNFEVERERFINSHDKQVLSTLNPGTS